MPQLFSNVVAYDHTAANDLQFRLIDSDLWLSGNVHAVTNDALYGKVNNQLATITTLDVASFDDFNLADLWFKNAGAGSNTTIYVVGITMSKAKMKELGVI